MAMLTAEEAPAPLEAIHATKKEKTTATIAMKSNPGLEPLMKVGYRKPTT